MYFLYFGKITVSILLVINNYLGWRIVHLMLILLLIIIRVNIWVICIWRKYIVILFRILLSISLIRNHKIPSWYSIRELLTTLIANSKIGHFLLYFVIHLFINPKAQLIKCVIILGLQPNISVTQKVDSLGFKTLKQITI